MVMGDAAAAASAPLNVAVSIRFHPPRQGLHCGTVLPKGCCGGVTGSGSCGVLMPWLRHRHWCSECVTEQWCRSQDWGLKTAALHLTW